MAMDICEVCGLSFRGDICLTCGASEVEEIGSGESTVLEDKFSEEVNLPFDLQSPNGNISNVPVFGLEGSPDLPKIENLRENNEKTPFSDNIPFGIEDQPNQPSRKNLIFGLQETPDFDE
tara:strand:+ start:18534 stop:18893 length:360 start_codon:yes stop_codon:yes gene_type:complete